MAAIRVRRPGLLTTVQDRGRWGHQAAGVPVSGAMDPFAHRLANALVSNVREAATLEVTFAGPEIEFEDDRVIAVTGARFTVTANERPVPFGRPFEVSAGSRIRFGERVSGCRAYLAASGGFCPPPVLGSRATDLASRIGGVDGRALRAGDVVPLGPPAARDRAAAQPEPGPSAWLTMFDRPAQTASCVVRVLPGEDIEWFADDVLHQLQSAPYQVGTESNRMGYRLDGPACRRACGDHYLSSATYLGAIQVPGPGHLILLMADRPTTGGYPKVATTIAADVGRVAQCAPGELVRFEVCNAETARRALDEWEQALAEIEVRSV